MGKTIKLIEAFVDDVCEAGAREDSIAVSMNQPAIDRRWERVQRLSPVLPRFRGWHVPGRGPMDASGRIPAMAIALHVDGLGNAFVLFDNGDRRQYLSGEKIA